MKLNYRSILFFFTWLIWLQAPNRCLAQNTDIESLTSLFDSARALLEDRRFNEACTLFLRVDQELHIQEQTHTNLYIENKLKLANSFLATRQREKAKSEASELDSICNVKDSLCHAFFPQIKFLLGNIGIHGGEYQEAMNHYLEGIALMDSTMDKYHHILSSLHGNLAYCYKITEDNQKALIHSRRSLLHFHRSGGNTMRLAVLQIGISNLLKNMGDLQQANAYLDSALHIAVNNSSASKEFISTLYYSKANIYRRKGDLTAALRFNQLAEVTISQEAKVDSLEFANILFGRANILRMMDDVDGAISLRKKSGDIYRRNVSPQYPALADVYLGLSHSYLDKKFYDSTSHFSEKAINTFSRLDGEFGPSVYKAKLNLAVVLGRVGDISKSRAIFNELVQNVKDHFPEMKNTEAYLSAISHFISMLEKSGSPEEADNYLEGLTKLADSLSQTTYRTYSDVYLSACSRIGEVYWNRYEENRLKDDYDNSVKYFLEAQRYKERAIVKLIDEVSIRRIIRQSLHSFYRLLEAYSKDNVNSDVNSLIGLIEENRYQILRNELLLADFSKNSGNAELTEKFNEAQNRLSSIKDSSEYYDALKSYQLLREQLSDNLLVEYQKSETDLNSVRHYAQQSECTFVVFQELDDEILTIVINPKEVKVFRLPFTILERRTIDAFVENLSHPPKSSDDLDDYVWSACDVQQFLIPDLTLLITEDVIVLADEVTSRIPFEALLSNYSFKNKNWRTLSYLLNDKNITYAHSLRQAMMTWDVNNKSSALIVAPFIDQDALEIDEHMNFDEIKAIQKAFDDSDLLLGPTSAEVVFEMARNHNMAHFATHGGLDNEYQPTIYLDSSLNKNRAITLRSLYGQQLNIQMVFLSACHSGQGLFTAGKGILSIARGFFLAKCQGVISSLWAISDYATSALAKSFYSFVKQGVTYSESLTKAKLKYINEVDEDLLSHPYYWSSLLFVGQKDANYMSGPGKTWYFLIIVLAIIVVLVYYIR